ncbi:MAG TPA: tyrosine-type recombinase/integrase, partial [Ktedonobacteraceae bacterium]
MHLMVVALLPHDIPISAIPDEVDNLLSLPFRSRLVVPYKVYLSEEELRLCWMDSLPQQRAAGSGEYLTLVHDEPFFTKFVRDRGGYYIWRMGALPRMWEHWWIGGRWDGIVPGQSNIGDSVCCCADWEEHLDKNFCQVSGLPTDLIPSALITLEGEWHPIQGAWYPRNRALRPRSFADLVQPYRDWLAVVVDCQLPPACRIITSSFRASPSTMPIDLTSAALAYLRSTFPKDLLPRENEVSHLYVWACACNWRVCQRRKDRAPTTVRDWLEEWLLRLQQSHHLRLVWRAYRAIGNFIQWSTRQQQWSLAVTDLTPNTLVAYVAALQDTHAPNVKWRWAAVYAWCAWLAEMQAVPANPACGLKHLVQPVHHVPYGFTSDQVQRLLEATSLSHFPERDQSLLLLLLETGMHIRECVGLTWGDLRFGTKQGTVWIKSTPPHVSRWAPLTLTACQRFLDYAAKLLQVEPTIEAIQEAFPLEMHYDPLWQSRRGYPLSVSDLTCILASLAQRAGGFIAPPATARRLRETAILRYLAASPQDLDGLAIRLGL